MGVVSRTADLFYTYKFLKLLTTPWEETEAYQLGIIDSKGRVLIRPSRFSTSEQKDAYTLFHRLVFNIKRLLAKVPGGSSRFATYASALYLLREEFGLSDSQIELIMKELEIEVDSITESWYILGDDSLAPGIYTLKQDIAIPKTGELSALRGSKIRVDEDSNPHGHMLGQPLYEVTHLPTKQKIFVSAKDLLR